MEQATACDLSRGIVTDERSRTVIFHLPAHPIRTSWATSPSAASRRLCLPELLFATPDSTRSLARVRTKSRARAREIRYVRNSTFRES